MSPVDAVPSTTRRALAAICAQTATRSRESARKGVAGQGRRDPRQSGREIRISSARRRARRRRRPAAARRTASPATSATCPGPVTGRWVGRRGRGGGDGRDAGAASRGHRGRWLGAAGGVGAAGGSASTTGGAGVVSTPGAPSRAVPSRGRSRPNRGCRLRAGVGSWSARRPRWSPVPPSAPARPSSRRSRHPGLPAPPPPRSTHRGRASSPSPSPVRLWSSASSLSPYARSQEERGDHRRSARAGAGRIGPSVPSGAARKAPLTASAARQHSQRQRGGAE